MDADEYLKTVSYVLCSEGLKEASVAGSLGSMYDSPNSIVS